MKTMFDSFWRALMYCLHPKVLGLSLLPLLVAGVVTLGVNYVFWESALAAVRSMLESWSLVNSMLLWMSNMLGTGFRTVFEQMILVALEIPVVVAFVLVLVGLWSTPAAVSMVAQRRFPTLERRHGGAWWKGVLWSLLWTFAALLAVLVTLPLWLVPGLALLLPPLIWGWLTAHVMGFDALAEHATADERHALLRAHRWPMLVMGILTGFLCGVPSLVWTLGPTILIAAPFVMIVVIWLYTMIFTFSALWFTHYALTVLAQLRGAEAALHAVQPAMPTAAPLPMVEEVPRHDRFPATRKTPPTRCDDGPHSLRSSPPEGAGRLAPERPRARRRRRGSRDARNLEARMIFGALIIGDEILSGRREDKHLARVIAALESRGLALAWARYIGDEPERITAELRAAAASGDTAFCFGGIGATPDDHTRQCAAAALGAALVLHPDAAALIEQRGREMAAEKGLVYDTAGPDHERRLQMGVFPRGATLIPNPYNRIPGFSVGRLHFMPGFPVMAHPMLDWLLDTLYAKEGGRRALHAVRVRGTNESALIPVFQSVEADYPGVLTFSLPSVDHAEYGPHIEIGVKGADAARVAEAMAALRAGAARAGAVEIG